MVLVDTSIWSLALRRRPKSLSAEELRLVEEWQRLVTEGAAALIGPIRQEILSGVRRPEAFRDLRQALSDFAYLGIEPVDYDRAAEFFNLYRTHGITGGSIDMLIAAVAYRHDVALFAADTDYPRY